MTNEEKKKRRQVEAVSRLAAAQGQLYEASNHVWRIGTLEGVTPQEEETLRRVQKLLGEATNRLATLRGQWTKL